MRCLVSPILLLLALGATVAVYHPVPGIYFFADDFVCQMQIVERGLVGYLMSPFGGHTLVVRNLVFWLWYHAFGFRPEPYHWALLVTHLVNVWLLFRVVRLLTDCLAIACLGAAAWGASPLCVGTIGWYSVYGHALVATILLIVLDQVARNPAPSLRRVGAWCLLLLAGTTCFGVGIGIALLFPVTLWLLAPDGFRDRRLYALAILFPLAVVALYFAYRRASALLGLLPPSELGVVRYGMRRMEPIVTMTSHLLGLGVASLVLGFHLSPADYPGTAADLAIAAYVASAIAALVAGDRSFRRRLAGLLVLTVGAYTIIAAGRANLMMDAWRMPPPVAARQLRYHYAGLLPLVIIACLVLDRVRASRAVRTVTLAIWFAVAGHGFLRSDWRIDQRPTFRRFVESSWQRIDVPIDAAPRGADVYIPNWPLWPGMLGAVRQEGDFPGLAALFALRYPEDVVRGHRVYFVETNRALLTAVRNGHHPRLTRLLVDTRPRGG